MLVFKEYGPASQKPAGLFAEIAGRLFLPQAAAAGENAEGGI